MLAETLYSTVSHTMLRQVKLSQSGVYLQKKRQQEKGEQESEREREREWWVRSERGAEDGKRERGREGG